MIRWLNTQPTWSIILASFILLLFSWEAVVIIGNYPQFILPGPTAVMQAFITLLTNGTLLYHTSQTLSEVLVGLLISCLIALPLGYLLVKSPLAERLVSPYLIASQAVPVIAIAPLLTIWIQSTYWLRVLVATIVVFFPILINIITGLRSVPPELYNLMKALQATRGQIFSKLELPAALPIILAGLKVGATLSVIGALVGEFVQNKSPGLGYLLIFSRQFYKTADVFVVLFTLSAMALSLYAIVTLLERKLLHWQVKR